MLTEIRQTARRLLREPGFTAVVLATLALGLGANTAIFGVVHAVLLAPLPYERPEELVRVVSLYEGEYSTSSAADFVDWRRDNEVFTDLAAYRVGRSALARPGGGEAVDTVWVTPGYFSLLGRPPAHGGAFGAENGEPGNDRVVILGHDLWRSHFGEAHDVIGRNLEIDGESRRVVGVAAPGFAPEGARLFLPLSFDSGELEDNRGSHWLRVLGRLRPGGSVEEATESMVALTAALEAEYPDSNAEYSAEVIPLKDAVVGDRRPALLLLLGAVGLVLLIACANVANLLLARAAGRRREAAVRTALGASTGRLVRAQLLESLLLAAAGGGLGLLLATWGLELLVRFRGEDLPRLAEASVRGPVLAFAGGLIVLTALLVGLLPAFGATSRRRDMAGRLRDGGRGGENGRGQMVRRGLVVAELALSVMLLAGAGLLLRSFVQLSAVEPGFEVADRVTFNVLLHDGGYPELADNRRFYADLRRELAALPGVDDVALAFGMPFRNFNMTITVEELDGAPAYTDPAEVRVSRVRLVTPGYFELMGIPRVAGRTFAEGDRYGSEQVVVVNQSAAEMLWPEATSPVDHSLRMGIRMDDAEPYGGGRVVGVVADVRTAGLAEEPAPEVYLVLDQTPIGLVSVVMKTSLPPTALAEPTRRALASLDESLPLMDFEPLTDLRRESLAETRLQMALLAGFALTALLLASLGVYGVMAHAVGASTREIGIRMALGAHAGEILSGWLGKAFALAAVGGLLGVALAFALARVLGASLSGLLYEVPTTDPWTLGGVVVLLTFVALLASYLPARRAARVDPAVVLKGA